MTRARGSFRITSWNEETYEERDGGGKLTRAWGDQSFSGDISGDGAVTWLMAYRPDGSAQYVGLQRIDGSVGDRKGSFVIEASGEFDGSSSSGSWTVVAGSGTKDLAGIRGSGRFEAPGGPEASYELDHELD